MGVDPDPGRRVFAIPARNGRHRHVFFCLTLFIIFLSISFFQFAIAATKESKAPKVQNPKVVFSKGLLTIPAINAGRNREKVRECLIDIIFTIFSMPHRRGVVRVVWWR